MTTVSDESGNLAVSLRAFSPTSTTTNAAVTASSAAVSLGETFTRPRPARFVNNGTQVVFVRFDGVTVTANNGIPILPGTVEMFTLLANASVVAIAAATGSTLYITIGEGA